MPLISYFQPRNSKKKLDQKSYKNNLILRRDWTSTSEIRIYSLEKLKKTSSNCTFSDLFGFIEFFRTFSEFFGLFRNFFWTFFGLFRIFLDFFGLQGNMVSLFWWEISVHTAVSYFRPCSLSSSSSISLFSLKKRREQKAERPRKALPVLLSAFAVCLGCFFSLF